MIASSNDLAMFLASNTGAPDLSDWQQSWPCRWSRDIRGGFGARSAIAPRRTLRCVVAVVHPMFLVHDFAIELVLDEFLLGEALVTPGLESAESNSMRLVLPRSSQQVRDGFSGNAIG